MELDEKDKKILDALLVDSDRTTRELSNYLGIPATTIHNHKKKLEKSGVIKRYVAEPDYKKIDRGVHAYVLVTINYDATKNVSQEDIAQRIKALGAQSVSIVTGDTDIIAQVRVSDIDSLNDFITQRLRGIPGVERTRTLISLNEA